MENQYLYGRGFNSKVLRMTKISHLKHQRKKNPRDHRDHWGLMGRWNGDSNPTWRCTTFKLPRALEDRRIYRCVFYEEWEMLEMSSLVWCLKMWKRLGLRVARLLFFDFFLDLISSCTFLDHIQLVNAAKKAPRRHVKMVFAASRHVFKQESLWHTTPVYACLEVQIQWTKWIYFTIRMVVSQLMGVWPHG